MKNSLITFTIIAATLTLQAGEIPVEHLREDTKRSEKPAPAGAAVTRGLTRGYGTPPPPPPPAPTRSYLRGQVIIEEQIGDKLVTTVVPYVPIPVLFRVGTAEILPESRGTIERIATELKNPAHSGSRFLVEGHTSTEGEAAFNQSLSEKRAKAIFAELVATHHVPSERIEPKGFGPAHVEVQENASDPASLEFQRKQNRRVLVSKLP